MIKRADNPHFRNWHFIAGSLKNAVDYIYEKFPDSDLVKEFHHYNKHIASQDRMGANGFELSHHKFRALYIEETAGAFSYLKEFFEYESTLEDSRGANYTNPRWAQEILRDLMIWGCFDYAHTQNPLEIQVEIDQYLKKCNAFKSSLKPVFNKLKTNADVYKIEFTLAFKGDEEAFFDWSNKMNINETVLKLADMQGRNYDIKCLFMDKDWDAKTISFEMISTSSFKALFEAWLPDANIIETCRNLASGTRFASPSDPLNKPEEIVIKNLPRKPVLKRRKEK